MYFFVQCCGTNVGKQLTVRYFITSQIYICMWIVNIIHTIEKWPCQECIEVNYGFVNIWYTFLIKCSVKMKQMIWFILQSFLNLFIRYLISAKTSISFSEMSFEQAATYFFKEQISWSHEKVWLFKLTYHQLLSFKEVNWLYPFKK